MGGFGSGRWGWMVTRPTTDGLLRRDERELAPGEVRDRASLRGNRDVAAAGRHTVKLDPGRVRCRPAGRGGAGLPDTAGGRGTAASEGAGRARRGGLHPRRRPALVSLSRRPSAAPSEDSAGAPRLRRPGPSGGPVVPHQAAGDVIGGVRAAGTATRRLGACRARRVGCRHDCPDRPPGPEPWAARITERSYVSRPLRRPGAMGKRALRSPVARADEQVLGQANGRGGITPAVRWFASTRSARLAIAARVAAARLGQAPADHVANG